MTEAMLLKRIADTLAAEEGASNPEALRAMIDAYEDRTDQRLPDGDGEDYKIVELMLQAALRVLVRP